METINEQIDVQVPLTEAYNQWTQFETFPQFVPELKEVKQIDDQHVHWRAELAGTAIEWDSEITQQVPDEIIAWRSTTGPQNTGYVEFEPVSPTATRVTLQLNYEPDARVRDTLGRMGMSMQRVRAELAHFKEFMERRRHATGAWRGSINAPGA
jgi:uncharacterized membrane protein